jgi:hypothetical protein
MTLRLMPARPVRHLTVMRARLIPLILALPVLGPGCTGRADLPSEASHLTTCLRAGEGGPSAREGFCHLLRFYPKPDVADTCWEKAPQRRLRWKTWCHLSFRWHP